MSKLMELLALLATYAFLLAIPALADDAASNEAIRVEIEYLREAGRLSIGGIDIATGSVCADVPSPG